jgi:hypothetical protein
MITINRDPTQGVSTFIDRIIERGSPTLETSVDHQFSRMFHSMLGSQAVNAIGNEGFTLALIGNLAAEIAFEALLLRGAHFRLPVYDTLASITDDNARCLIVPLANERATTLLVLDPDRPGVERATQDLHLPEDLIRTATRRILDSADIEPTYPGAPDQDPFATVFTIFAQAGSESLEQAFAIAPPEILVAPRPQMVPLGSPWPSLRVSCEGQYSTSGVYCFDAEDEFGVTACLHGTGPEGTVVKVDGVKTYVKHAHTIQDIVFLPLPEDPRPPVPVRGAGGILRERGPSQYDDAEFHGSSSGACKTKITSHDAGLLRKRPTVQLKVQTKADTNTGDSGAALIDYADRVIGFAFERTALGEEPELTDWIWAANALDALQLRPA